MTYQDTRESLLDALHGLELQSAGTAESAQRPVQLTPADRSSHRCASDLMQAAAVARIALGLPDKPTGVDLLVALNKAYAAGRLDTIGVIACEQAA